MKSTVTSKGQVTIPKALRDRLGLTTGVVLDFREEHGHLVASRAETDDPVAAVYGLFRDGRGTDEVMQALRSESDR